MKTIFLKHKRLLIIISIILTFLIVFFLLLRFTPYKALHQFEKNAWSTAIYDRNGILLQILPLKDGLRREFTSLENFPKELVSMVIKAEDKKFYTHNGIDNMAILRALFQNITNKKRISGASTITMQLARIIEPAKKRTLLSKTIEAFNALRIESRLSKNEILELYLNTVPFGSQVAGFCSAARYFYKLPLTSLSKEKIETLVLTPRNPSLYKPKTIPFSYPFLLPHFINHIKPLVKNKKNVQLSIDYTLCKQTQYYLRAAIEENKDSRLQNGACIAIENETGKILVWINSSEWNDPEKNGAIDGCLVKMQPGSTMKPFLYALALENGYTPASILEDIPSRFGSKEIYIPQNFNNHYNGPIRFRVALASSLNVPAVKLLYDIGIQKYAEKLFELSFDSLKDNALESELSLALGGGEITLQELVKAFSVFANDGILKDESFYLENPVLTNKKRVYRRDTARLICSILSDSNARELGFGHAQSFITDFPSIFKTGTSNQYQNITALASSTDYTVGVWMGNFRGNTIIGKTGSSIPAKIAKNVLIELNKKNGNKKKEFKKPQDYEFIDICPLSGLKVGPFCPSSIKEYLPIETKDGKKRCSWHKENNEISYPATYQEWFFQKDRRGSINYTGTQLSFIQPNMNNIFILNESLQNIEQVIPLVIVGGQKNTLDIIYDGTWVKNIKRPFETVLPVEKGSHTVKIICGDEEKSVNFTVK